MNPFATSTSKCILVFLLVTGSSASAQNSLNSNAIFRDLGEASRNASACRSSVTTSSRYTSDWNAAFLKSATGGDSIKRNHEPYSNIWSGFTNDAYVARLSNDRKLASKVAHALNESAKNNILLSTMTLKEARGAGLKCYNSGDVSKPCASHLSQTAAEYFSASALAAFLITPLNQELDQVRFNQWLDVGYRKYVEPLVDDLSNNPGINEQMNYRISMLIYALQKNDSRLFTKHAGLGIRQIDRLIDKAGRIENSSYRGVRAVFYHSLAVDSILGFGELLESQGVPFYSRSDIGQKIRESYLLALASARDYNILERLGTRGRNHTVDEKQARRRLHPLATSLIWIGGKRFGITEGFVPRDGLDAITMIFPDCLYADYRTKILKLSR